MTESVLSINERPDPHCEESGPSNLVKALIGTRQDNSITETSCLVIPPSRSQRCFSQFDRKTDCYMNGSSMSLMPIVGRQVLVRGRQPKARSTRARLGIRIMGRGPFTVAVCGTQTRHGVSVNKKSGRS